MNNINENNSFVTMRACWIRHQLRLLHCEKLAGIKSLTKQEPMAVLEAKGVVISCLQVTKRGARQYRCLTYTLSRSYEKDVYPLPSHSFSSGNPVDIWQNVDSYTGNEFVSFGVISRLTSMEIEITISDENLMLDRFLNSGFLVRLHKSGNAKMFERIETCLNQLSRPDNAPSHLFQVLFNESEPYELLPEVPFSLLENGVLDLFNKGLNESQVDAVKFSLISTDIAVIHGPPGTGKTTTLVEIILQHVKLGKKVLAVAPSNLAVDNLLENLTYANANVVRVGHPARTTQKAQERSLDAFIEHSNVIIQNIRSRIETLIILEQHYLEDTDVYHNQLIQNAYEMIDLQAELKKRERHSSREILLTFDVILTTLTSIGNTGPLEWLPKEHFDLTVIDECGQSIECACYMSMMKSPKLLIAGDYQQLPPTVVSKEAEGAGLSISLMERVIGMYGDRLTRVLNIQYRMNSCIMNWASAAMYNEQLRAHESVRDHLLYHMNGVARNKETEYALILIDTAGYKLESVSGYNQSKINEGEAALLVKQVKRLIMSGVQERDIAVISPYNLQVRLIRKLLQGIHPAVEVQSIDGFQGREKETVLISLVRSNKRGHIGFLTENRRLNVAVTRARRQLTLVCDITTVCRHPFIKTLVDYMIGNGIVKFGPEFEAEVDIQPRSDWNVASNCVRMNYLASRN